MSLVCLLDKKRVRERGMGRRTRYIGGEKERDRGTHTHTHTHTEREREREREREQRKHRAHSETEMLISYVRKIYDDLAREA